MIDTVVTVAREITSLVEGAAVLVLAVSGTLAALGFKKRALQERMEGAAHTAVRYIEQMRKVRALEGGITLNAKQLAPLALQEAKRLVPEANDVTLQVMIEAAVNQLPEFAHKALPARGADGRFVARGE
jgi:hypothetical protein